MSLVHVNLWVYEFPLNGFGACNFLFDSLIFQSGEKKKEKRNATKPRNPMWKGKKKKKREPKPKNLVKKNGKKKKNATKSINQREKKKTQA